MRGPDELSLFFLAGHALFFLASAFISPYLARSSLAALRELVTDADIYTLEFNPAARLAPQQKATMLGSLVLADYMFFERDNAPCSQNGCNLCALYCCGCVVPCGLGRKTCRN